MVTVLLKSGMGNQMFQYAFGKRIAMMHNTDLQLDLSLLLDRSRKNHVFRDYDLSIFNIKEKFVISPSILKKIYRIKSSKLRKTLQFYSSLGKNIVNEAHFHVDEDLIQNPSDNTLYNGFWQSARYFEDIDDTIRKEFSFKHPIQSDSISLLEKIDNSNAVCLNVRRTDFLKNDTLNSTSKTYFLEAVRLMATKVSNPHFFVFSDDIEWCIENIVLDYPTTIVNHAHKGIKFGNYLLLMKACKHFIIPNSSFAWWAIWLNASPSKVVIAPKNWFQSTKYITNDLIPKQWLRL